MPYRLGMLAAAEAASLLGWTEDCSAFAELAVQPHISHNSLVSDDLQATRVLANRQIPARRCQHSLPSAGLINNVNASWLNTSARSNLFEPVPKYRRVDGAVYFAYEEGAS